MASSQSSATAVLDDDASEARAAITRKLYISHLLSTWNTRLFEFGAVLFLANIYPDTLFPLSVYALLRALAAVLLSPFIGQYIDKNDRLRTIRVSIVGQRLAVILSCLLFWSLLHFPRRSASFTALVLGILSLLACVEKLCSIMNSVSVERDWVVVISGESDAFLQDLNSQMRRIDLFCKVVGPLTVALLDGWSPRIAILTTLCLNLLSMTLEYGLIARVFKAVPALREVLADQPSWNLEEACNPEPDPPAAQPSPPTALQVQLASIMTSLRLYAASPAFLPSFALSLLYLSVLSFSGQMTTYLLALPTLTAPLVGLLRALSNVFELSSTWLAPYLIARIGPTRAGIWCLSWQILCLSAAVSTFVYPAIPSATTTTTTTIFIAAIILSRVGLYAFDLAAQLIVQSSIPPPNRGSFSATEAGVQNFFEVITFATTIIFPKPSQFRYPALISFTAVCCAGTLYAKYVRDRRGHLLHLPCCSKVQEGGIRTRRRSNACRSGSGCEYEMVASAEEEPGQPRMAANAAVSNL